MTTLDEAAAAYLKAQLQPFLSLNHEAEVKAGESEPSVIGLWGEDAIELPIRNEDAELLNALNAVRLPPRFTAIWHEDTCEFEVIYTVLNKDNYLLDRTFDFRLKGVAYHCSFEASSSRLRAIARTARPSGSESRSNFRNLQAFYRFERMRYDHPDSDFAKNGHPTSFWIRGITEFDDEQVADLARNLNFHMSYFDRSSPMIMVHEDRVSAHAIDEEEPRQFGDFPDTLSAREIDQHLLILWESARSGDPFLRFIHYYQILEYCGFYYVKDEVQRSVERAIAAPDAASRPERAAQQILEVIATEKRHENDKINAMIKECVNLQDMWNVLQGSLNRFEKPVELDGGFTLPALVSADSSYDQFAETWNDKFSSAIHQVRNALVHARELRQVATIAPTSANYLKLSPWLVPLEQTAADIVLYRRL